MQRIDCSRVLSMVALMAMAGSAIANPPPPRGPEDRPPPPPASPMEGPEVRDDRHPGVPSQFTEGSMTAKNMRGMVIPPAAYQEILAKMRRDDAPEDIRLTLDQREQIREIMERVRTEAREKGARPGGKDAGKPPRGPGPDGLPPPPAEGRGQRPREEGEVRRSFGDAQQQVWAILNQEQREFVLRESEGYRQVRERKNAEQYVERRLGKEGGRERRPPADRPGGPEGDRGPGRERMERIRDLLMRLEPEERDRVLERLERELRDRLEGRPEERPERGERPPPERRRERDRRPGEGSAVDRGPRGDRSPPPPRPEQDLAPR